MYYSSNHKDPLINAREAEAFLQEIQPGQRAPKRDTTRASILPCLLKAPKEETIAPTECVVLGYN